MSDSPRPDDATERVDRAAADAESAIQDAQHRTEERIRDARDAATARVRRTQEQVESKVRETESRLRRQITDVERAVGGGLSDPTPAESVDEAMEQAADLRRAIDRDLDALEARLPPPDVLAEKARTYGGAALAAVAVGAAAALGRKQRSQRKKLEREAKAHAAAIARYLPQASGEPRQLVEERGGKGPIVLLFLVAAAVGAYVYNRRRGSGDDEPDPWGPA